jgi:predicted HNH restriction endonuclease
MPCTICGGPLRGKQRRFCSRVCKNKDTNYHHQSYVRQQERGKQAKLRLIALLGGQCATCGYRRNYSALEFHHVDPREKRFQLDMRSLSNMNWEVILEEARKCVLLCANCHAERHNPHSIMLEHVSQR